MSVTPRPWFAGYWGKRCRKPPPHSRAHECVFEPERWNLEENEDYTAFKGIGAENGENVVTMEYDELTAEPDDLRFIIRAVNAHDALVAALRGYVDDHVLAARQEEAAITGLSAPSDMCCQCALCVNGRAALKFATEETA